MSLGGETEFPFDDEVGGACKVCGAPLRYGERHRKCGDATATAAAPPQLRGRPEPLDAEERYCLEQLHAIRRAHEIAAKPYIDRLVRIRSLRPVPGWSAALYGMQGVLEAAAQLNIRDKPRR